MRLKEGLPFVFCLCQNRSVRNLISNLFIALLAAVVLSSSKVLSEIKKESGQLVTTAVGQFADNFLTSRQANMNFFVESVLYGGKGKNIPSRFYPVDSKEFSKEVTAILIERVVYEDSKSFTGMQVSEAEVKASVGQFLKIAGNNSLWKSLAVSDEELLELVQKKLQSKKYIRFKVDSSVVPITDDEALVYFEENRSKFGNLPFENFKQNIRAFLGRQQIDRRLREWFEVLQNKYKVKNLLSESA